MNMRKIIAVLAAMLMLCSIIPMGAMVSAAALVDYDFEDGSLGSWKYDTTNDTLEVVDGAMKWTTISWKNTYLNFKATANTDYKLTIRAKADVNATVDVKFLNGSWGTSGIEKTTQTYTTEWAEYTYIFNSLEYGGLVLLFQSHKATTIYYDSVKIETYVAPKDPEFPENAIYTETFENGSLNGWTSNCSVVSTAGLAATNAEGGNYCLEFISPNYSYTNYKMTNLEKNTDYVVTFSILSATSGYPINARVRDSAGDLGYVQYTPSITAWETHSYLFNSGNNTSANLRFQAAWTTGTYYIDNISVAPIDLSAVANDGHIMNGNFESGNNLGWNASANTTIVADPTGAGQGYVIKTFETGNSVDMFTQEFKNLVAGKTYTLSFKVYGYGSATNNVFFIRVPKDVTFSNPTGIATSDSGKTYVARFNMNANTGKWITVTLDFVAASSTALIQFQNYRTDQGFYYFDDITLSHAYDATVTDPDCVNGGYTTYTCACGATYTNNATDALGHSYVDGICGVCGAEDPNYEPPHVCEYAVSETVDADCVNDGYIVYTCGGCGDSYTEAIPAAHTYTDNCDEYCDVCDEWRIAEHNLTYVPGVVPANCQETGYDEYWECQDCGKLFGDAEGSWQVNPAWIYYTGDCVRPEGSIPCAVVPCVVCGNDTYGDACTRPEDAPACQDAECVYCGELIWGEGHSYGYDEETWESLIPLCQPGDCIYCGEHLEYIYEHENGSWAPCSVDGECAYGCGLQYPATGEHMFDEGQNVCTGGLCWLCWEEIEAAGHSYDAVVTEPDCTNGGYTTHTCGGCGDSYVDNETEALGHTSSGPATCEEDEYCTVCDRILNYALGHEYDNEFDVDCNVCGDIRKIELPVVGNKTSASEDVSGVAALFSIDVEGLAIMEGTKTEADFTKATFNGYNLISMGAIASNGVASKKIPVVYMYELDDEGTTYAIRVKGIPTDKYDVPITFTPYFIVEIDGVEVTLYDDAVTASYNGIMG